MLGRSANAGLPGLLVVFLLMRVSNVAAQERDLFQKGNIGIEFGAAPMIEAWSFNGSKEQMIEATASFWGALNDRVAVGIEFHHARIFQRAPDAFLQGASPLVRVRLNQHPRWRWFAEIGPGVSWSDFITPPNGTKFNYLFQAGTGLTRRVGARAHLNVAYRFFHVSNHAREGKDHNPDFEMLGAYVGWGLMF